MIQRVILSNPEKAKDFNYFNDFSNTWHWLMNLPETDQRNHAIKSLERGKKQYDNEFLNQMGWTNDSR